MASVHAGHRERTKKEFRKGGLAHMEPHRVLELLLYYSIPQKDVNELAHRLIDTFGGFDKVLEADYRRLLEVKGVGENTATQLKLLLESYRYYEMQKNSEAFYATSADAAMCYARSLFIGETRELSYLLCFDSTLRLNNCEKIAEGCFNAVSVSVRRVVEIAVANKAAAVILTHNHTGNVAMPSDDDIATTREIVKALHLVGTDVADHIIVCNTHAISMGQTSALHNIKQQLHI